MTNTRCIHRAGCPKPNVCSKVGHCTSMTETDVAMKVHRWQVPAPAEIHQPRMHIDAVWAEDYDALLREAERLRAEIRSLDQANGGALQEIERLTRDMAALQSQWDDMQQGFVEVFGEPVRDAIELLGATERLRSAHEPFVHPCGYFSCVLPAGHDGVHQFPNRPALKSGA